MPNRLSATTIAQRSVAQNGQYSAPMYSTSGLPPLVSAGPLAAISGDFGRLPFPTWASVAAGTLVTSLATAGRLTLAPADAGAADPPELSLTTTKATTMATTTRMLPPTMKSLLRCSARRAAACCSAIRALALCCRLRAALLTGQPCSRLALAGWRSCTRSGRTAGR